MLIYLSMNSKRGTVIIVQSQHFAEVAARHDRISLAKLLSHVGNMSTIAIGLVRIASELLARNEVAYNGNMTKCMFCYPAASLGRKSASHQGESAYSGLVAR